MKKIIDFAFSHVRAILLILVFLFLAGWQSYQKIAKESAPDVPIPIIVVSVAQEAVSAQDAERLLLKPLEKELKSVEGIKEISGSSSTGMASVTLEFDAGFSNEKALLDVREKVDLARAELPDDAKEPQIKEVNVALFPILSVALSGSLPERELLIIARKLQDGLEALPGVLEANIGGDLTEVLDVITEPTLLETYGISLLDLITLVDRNNQLIAAGAIDEGAGNMVLKVPGLIEKTQDINQLPLKSVGNQVVKLQDVATLSYGFKRPQTIARINGKRAIVLEIKKRMGANIINVVSSVRQFIEKNQHAFPHNLRIDYFQDASKKIKIMLSDLQNNIMSAMILVILIVISALGVRPALLVGLSIPGAFLVSIGTLYLVGITLNMVVLFSLILVVGMLVDGALVSTELAVRYMHEGKTSLQAFSLAAKRMAWPIIASVATTLVVFLPLLHWPGMVGKFMRYLPMTVIIALVASLFMALIFIPVLGYCLFSKKTPAALNAKGVALENEPVKKETLTGLMKYYIATLDRCLNHSGKLLVSVIVFFMLSCFSYVKFGAGVEFFPKIDADFIQVQVLARGDLSIKEKDALVAKVEQKLKGMNDLRIVYAKTIGDATKVRKAPADTIGIVQLELNDWQHRGKQSDILNELRQRTEAVPGIKIQIRQKKQGPKSNKPIELQLRSYDMNALLSATQKIRQALNGISGLTDVEDTLPLPGIEWHLEIDREEAARFNISVVTLGAVIKLVSNGLKISDYHPSDTDEEVDIRLRFPASYRHLDQLKQLRIPTAKGAVPMSNFIHFKPSHKISRIYHKGSMPSMNVSADVQSDVLADKKIKELQAAISTLSLPKNVEYTFKGDNESQKETREFLSNAFLIALFLMFLILLIQFNKFNQVFIVLSAVVLSTTGVFIGLLISGQPFSIVMSGLGVIALAGIVVNNNIILIDTYNEYIDKGFNARDAILKTANERLRPVLLTSITTILGLLPMVFSMTIDLLGQSISFGAPSTQWWVQLSSSIAGGLSFATVLTLILTPCLLMLASKANRRAFRAWLR